MKMETHVSAPGPGRVVQVLASPGTQVAPGDALVLLEPVA
jgi:urea carboxylase